VQMGYQSIDNTDWKETFISLQGIKWMFYKPVDPKENTQFNS
jgi:hypothetical protein